FLLALMLVRKFPFVQLAPFFKSIIQTFLASVGMGSMAYSMLYVGSLFLNQESFWGILVQGGLAGISGMIVGFLLLVMLENQDVADFLQVIKKRFWKTKVVQDAIITP